MIILRLPCCVSGRVCVCWGVGAKGLIVGKKIEDKTRQDKRWHDETRHYAGVAFRYDDVIVYSRQPWVHSGVTHYAPMVVRRRQWHRHIRRHWWAATSDETRDDETGQNKPGLDNIGQDTPRQDTTAYEPLSCLCKAHGRSWHPTQSVDGS